VQSSEAAPEKTEKKKIVEVTVKKGDSLDKIAKANGTTIKAIKTENDLKTDRLDIGQVLRVPVGTKKAKADKVAKAEKAAAKETKDAKDSKAVASGDTEFYTIKNGDNPWKIAKKFNIKVSEFLKLNDLDEDKARNLKVGEKVRVK
jgi:peptidoglycan endopeptidase LytF